VDSAYAEVERITRREARNFAYGIMVLPRPKRRAIAAIYAFARRVDDIADGELPDAEKRARLEELHVDLDASPSDPVLVALADARSRYPIPAGSLHDLVDGGLQDTEQRRYADFEELHGYCKRVAGAVGVSCIAVYGLGGAAARPRKRTGGGGLGEPGGSPNEPPFRERAEALGVALQLINIIRDVREDWELGRVYLPQDELVGYGVSEEDIAAGRATPHWQALMAFQASRARAYLEEGLELLDSLDSRSAACVGTFAGLYRATLDRIEARGFDVFDGSVRLSPLTKLRIVGAGLLR
jgi:15-cis-phytoene synthase